MMFGVPPHVGQGFLLKPTTGTDGNLLGDSGLVGSLT